MISKTIIQKIEEKIGCVEIAEKMANNISASEMNTLLLEVFRQRSRQLSAPDLLNQYLQNRFTSPSTVDPIAFRELELQLLKTATVFCYRPIQLSPVAPLGSCSAVATSDQHKIVSALRGTEVVADATNLIALHIAAEKKRTNGKETLRYCTTHRHLRAQSFDGPGMTAHFSVFCMVSAGKDAGHYAFEKESFLEHLSYYTSVLKELPGLENVWVKVRTPEASGEPSDLMKALIGIARETHPQLDIQYDASWNRPNAYYQGIQFKIYTSHKGRTFDLADGGLVDWSQQLLQNRKERMFISGLGIELLFKLLHHQLE